MPGWAWLCFADLLFADEDDRCCQSSRDLVEKVPHLSKLCRGRSHASDFGEIWELLERPDDFVIVESPGALERAIWSFNHHWRRQFVQFES